MADLHKRAADEMHARRTGHHDVQRLIRRELHSRTTVLDAADRKNLTAETKAVLDIEARLLENLLDTVDRDLNQRPDNAFS